jgi:hypothetical protein
VRWWCSCLGSFGGDGVALGGGGELEEHLLQARAVGLAQLDEGDAGGAASVVRPSPLGVTVMPALVSACSSARGSRPRT